MAKQRALDDAPDDPVGGRPARVVILSHEHADFDAVASQVGLAALIPGAVPVLPRQINENVADFLILYGHDLPLLEPDLLPRDRIDLAWMVDTDSAQAVRGMQSDTPRSLLDHHVAEIDNNEAASKHYVEYDVQAVGATATLVSERMRAAGLSPEPVVATLLLLAIHEDTGSLAFASTTARDARAVAWLMEAGADLAVARRFLHPPLTTAGNALFRALLADAEWLDIEGHDVVVVTASARGFDESVADVAQRVMRTLDPDALLTLVELDEHVLFVGRSATDAVDVAAGARALGGGGHPRAAASVVNLDRAKARQQLQGLIEDGTFQGPVTREAQIMTPVPLRCLSTTDTVEEALRVARSHGHEGYPVLDGDRVAGMVSRAALDLAVHHHLQNRPLSELLSPQAQRIRSTDSLARLRRLMTRFDVGQVPVVDDEELVGIVTRTDLLADLRRRDRERHTTDVRLDLDAVLGAPYRDAVQAAYALADERDERAYVVGGLPRDLLLGAARRVDVDLVVVGDAPALAHALASRHGGQAVTHGRFGTATWKRDDTVLDLVTARAESYARPAALPTVTAGSLRADLRRRDFTINTLALDLAPGRRGHVIDLFGGIQDLKAGRIRVLHGLSFVEDPTRILRAARFEQRLGMDMEPYTESLARGAVSWLAHVSPARVRAELRLAFAEPQRVLVLERLAELGALRAIASDLGFTTADREAQLRIDETWARWRGWTIGEGMEPHPAPVQRLVMWLAGQRDAGSRAAERLGLSRRSRLLLESVLRMLDVSSAWSQTASAREIEVGLEGGSPEALVLASALSTRAETRGAFELYGRELSAILPLLSSEELKALGVPPGPGFGELLRILRDAQLGERQIDRDAALAMVRGWLEERSGA